MKIYEKKKNPNQPPLVKKHQGLKKKKKKKKKISLFSPPPPGGGGGGEIVDAKKDLTSESAQPGFVWGVHAEFLRGSISSGLMLGC